MNKWIKWLIVLLMTGIIAAILIYFFVYNKPHPNYDKAEASYTLAVEDLFLEFKQDKGLAGSKYNGKVIALKGAVTRIEEADTLLIIVFVFEEGDFGEEGVRVTMLPGHTDKARQIDPGSPVMLKGLCTGYNDTDVILEKGSIVE